MVLVELTVTSLPVIVSVAIVSGATLLLVLCVCGKKKDKEEPQLTSVLTKDTTATPSTNGFVQTGQASSEAVKLDIDTAVTVLNTSRNSANSTSNHSRGNSLDLDQGQRQSGASTGSSPRPTTLSRELPDIPKKGHHHHDDRKSHAHLPELPGSTSRNNLATPGDKNTHSHTQLPQVPKPQQGAGTVATAEAGSPGKTRNGVVKTDTGSVGSASGKKAAATADMDDYDHIVEKKKGRPRSDYDHIVIEGQKKLIVARKEKASDEDDYSEVTDDKPENIYEGVPEEPGECMVLIKPGSFKKTDHAKRGGKVRKDDPYNTIEINDPPETDIDPPYNRIKDNDPPYNRIKGDVEKSVELYIDDIDPYDDVRDDASGGRPSIRKQKMTRKTPPLVDPYSFVDDERNVSNQTDPYSRVMDSEAEDPYNKVIDEESDSGRIVARTTTPVSYSDNDYATVNKTGEVEYAKVNKPSIRDRHRNSGAVSDLDTVTGNHSNIGASGNIPSSPREEIVHDEYATVVKVRKLSPGLNTPGGASSASEGTFPDTAPGSVGMTPPEPPRGYQDGGVGGDADHYNTVAMLGGDSTSSDQLEPTGMKKKEPPYNKLSVRESLASMNARVASNTYEYVSEVDNLYATVEGNSGDGVVTRPKSTQVNSNPRESVVSEYYAEIDGATSAPAPPSLDSLHETAKHHQEEFRRKVDPRPQDLDYYNLKEAQGNDHFEKGHSRTPSEQSQGHHSYHSGQGHFRTPSSDAMNLSFEGRATLATEENVDLDLDHSSRVVVDSEPDSVCLELDPNYETVEEARSKVKYEEINGARPKDIPTRTHIYEEADGDVKYGINGARPKDIPTRTHIYEEADSNVKKDIPTRTHIYEEADGDAKYEVVNESSEVEPAKIRHHVYEEVTVTNEAKRARQRALNQHTYEEVTDIKGKGQKSGKVTGQGQSGADVQKKKKGHERNSSGDHLLGISKKSGGDGKEKGKDGKRKSDGKDGKKAGDLAKK